MIRFTCPSCRAALKVPADFAASVVTCPKCSTSIEIPKKVLSEAAERGPLPARDARYDDEDVPRRRRKRRSSAFPPAALWIALVLAVVCRFAYTYFEFVGIRAYEEEGSLSDERRSYYHFQIALQWFLAALLWIGIFLRSNTARVLMAAWCVLTLIFLMFLSIGTVAFDKAPPATLVIFAIFGGLNIGIWLALAQESAKRYSSR